jgi:hypothetical protein
VTTVIINSEKRVATPAAVTAIVGPHFFEIHTDATVPTTAASSPAVVMYPTSDFEAPRFSAWTGRNPKFTPNVTNWRVIAIAATRKRRGDRSTLKRELNE